MTLAIEITIADVQKCFLFNIGHTLARVDIDRDGAGLTARACCAWNVRNRAKPLPCDL